MTETNNRSAKEKHLEYYRQMFEHDVNEAVYRIKVQVEAQKRYLEETRKKEGNA